MAERKTVKDDWGAYYKAVAARPPRDLFRQTMCRFPQAGNASRLAVDLGCGAGNETFALLDAGWTVLAIDQQPEALARIRALVTPDQQSRLTLQAAAFEDVDLPASDFIWASVSLPFSTPGDFSIVWEKIIAALKPGGRFAGDFFGPRHAWADRVDMNFHTAEQIQALCRSLHVEYFISEEGEKITANQGPQHWQAYAVVGRKP
jgi:tellurite methyltransferase